MSVEIVMPKLSDTMEEGTILKWLKRVGDAVSQGEILAEVETDKADMELEASAAGVLREIKVHEGESAAVGAVIALVEEKGATTGATAPRERGQHDDARDEQPNGRERGAAPVAAKVGAAGARGRDGGAKPAGGGARAGDGGGPAPNPAAAAASKATPGARKLAGERGVDLRALQGSGPGGRIVTDDVETAAKVPPARPTRAAAVPPETSRRATGDDAASRDETSAHEDGGRVATVERRELSRMRQSIARRMSEAFRDIPHFYVTAEIDMTEAARLKEALARGELFTTPISYTHMVLKATALALKRHPRLNASYVDGALELKGEVNLGIAVAVEDGLIVPVLRHVDEMPLAEVASAARDLVEHARRGRFGRDDLSGGTFTVSNMGMLDLEEFAAVINPPQAAILAVGAIKDRAVVRDGAVVVRRTMRVTVSCDHRIIDGVVAGHFLEELKRLLENPIVLVVRE